MELSDLFPLTHAHLVKFAYEWVLKSGSCGVAFREFNTGACNGEYPDVIGFSSGPTTIIECKTSRADFLADSKKMFRRYPEQGMGDYRYYFCPEGLIKVEELPEGWGLIYVNAEGKAKRKHRAEVKKANGFNIPYQHKKNIKAEHNLMYSALRRLQLRGRIEEVYIGLKTAINQTDSTKL